MARAMKESGIDWIGEIPKDWEIIKNKYLLSYVYSGGTPTSTNSKLYTEDEDGIPFVSIGDMSNSSFVTKTKKKLTIMGLQEKNLKVLEEGTILYSIYATIGAVSELKVKGTISQAILALIVKDLFNKQYYKYNLLAMKDYIFFTADGNTQFNLNAEKVWNFYFVFPILQKQKIIADFLDKKCQKIDSVLEKTRESIEEYKKLKNAVITQAVTKGIRPNRKMKDSGNLWLNEVPADWEIKKIKYIFRIKKDIAGKEGYTVLSITQKGIKPKDLSKNEGQIAENYSNYQLVNIGDFAMNHMDLLTGWVDISKYEGVTSPDYRVFVFQKPEEYSKEYYLYFMQMCYTNRIFYGLGQGVSGMGRWRLQADKFLNFTVTVPPLEEQKEIAAYLDKKCSEIDKLIEKKEQLITELETYKKSLIYEYVTGKKEVK